MAFLPVFRVVIALKSVLTPVKTFDGKRNVLTPAAATIVVQKGKLGHLGLLLTAASTLPPYDDHKQIN